MGNPRKQRVGPCGTDGSNCSRTPPPPGIAAPIGWPGIPARTAPPVIIEVVVEMILNVVVDFDGSVAAKIVDCVLIAVPLGVINIKSCWPGSGCCGNCRCRGILLRYLIRNLVFILLNRLIST